jgi:hypothetical protein
MQREHTQGHTTQRTILLVLLTAVVAGVVAAISTMAAMAASDRFDDVAADHPHEAGIGFAADSGVSIGCDAAGTEYCPNDAVTRAQMGTFMHRLSGTAEGTAPSVNAATLQGMTPEELQNGDGSRLEAIEGRLDDLEAQNEALQGEVDALTALLADVTRGEIDGQDTLRLSGMNLQVVNGEDDTETTNGLGNVIIGYNGETRVGADPDRDGSHYLVVGDGHGWTSYGGIVAGQDATASGPYATVTGGVSNHASGEHASVMGGRQNTADGDAGAIVGGQGNETTGGGEHTVLGGQGNSAGGLFANAISGGRDNTTEGSARWASILGGNAQTVNNDFGMHPN